MQTFDPHTAAPARSRLLRNLQWLYLAGVCVMLAAIRVAADRRGWATILAYGPRDAAIAPGVILILIGLCRRRLPWVAMVAVAIAAGPVMNFVLPWPRLLHRAPAGPVVHFLQLNADGHGTDGRKYDLPRVLALLRDTGRDVATVDEWPTDQPPPLPGGEWSCFRDDEQLVLSRWPIVDTRVFPSATFGRRCFAIGARLQLPGGRSQWVFNVHLETPRTGFEPLLRRRPNAYATLQQCLDDRDVESNEIQRWIVDQSNGRADAIVGGDFNMVGDGPVFRRRWGDWHDAFADAGWGWGQTKLQTGWRARIDHILGGDRRVPVQCWVGPDVNSDHLPLLADIAIAD